MKIIYVEDDAINAMVMKRFLSAYTCNIFTNGEEALEYCKNNPVDLILMDINLGSDCMDGVQTMKEIRKLNGFSKVPIIAVTAYAMPEDRGIFLSEGFDEYFSKPVDRMKLLTTVAMYGEQMNK